MAPRIVKIKITNGSSKEKNNNKIILLFYYLRVSC
jgi:hypothetical protein